LKIQKYTQLVKCQKGKKEEMNNWRLGKGRRKEKSRQK